MRGKGGDAHGEVVSSAELVCFHQLQCFPIEPNSSGSFTLEQK